MSLLDVRPIVTPVNGISCLNHQPARAGSRPRKPLAIFGQPADEKTFDA